MQFSAFIILLVLFRLLLLIYFISFQGDYIYPDSPMYIALANNLIDHMEFSISQQAPFVADVFRTPGYPGFLALIKLLGMENPYWTVFWQELVYAATIWIFYVYGKSLFDINIIRAGIVFLLLEPGGITYPKLFLSETLFLPFVTAGLLAIGHYLRSQHWRIMALAGIIMGLGAIIRPAILYFPIISACALLAFNYKSRSHWIAAGAMLISFFLIISPWLMRNYHYFGKAFLSGQQSHMIANFHVTKVWEHTRGWSQAQGQQEISKLVQQQQQELQQQLDRPLTPVEFFQVQLQVGIDELRKVPLNYLIHWLSGMGKTIAGPNLIEFYDIYEINLQRPHLFATVAQLGLLDGLVYYLKHIDYLFLVNAALTAIMGVLALLGSFSIISRKDCFLWIMLLMNFYFISMAGPMGEARFRFPVGVFWFIQAYIGCRWLLAKWPFNRHQQAYD